MTTYIMVDQKNRLSTNGTVQSLAKFAKDNLFINPRRLERKPFPHFILTQQMRYEALKAGAAEVTTEHANHVHRHAIATPRYSDKREL